jgi:hypothetical protein
LHLCLCVCLSVRAHNSNTINPVDLKFLHKEGCTRGSDLLEFGLDPDPDSIIFQRFAKRRGSSVSYCLVCFTAKGTEVLDSVEYKCHVTV